MMVRMMKQWMLFGMGAMVAGFLHAQEPAVVVVEPLCKATEAWNQTGNLNAYVGLGMGYPCGCDPLAWGQVVTYHGLVTKYPAAGWKPKPTTGQVALCDSSGALINFEIRTTLPGEYNWADIRDRGAGVSRLMRDLGALGHTAYRPGGTSGTFGSKNAVDYFTYQNAGYLFEPPFYWKGNDHLLQENWSGLVESQLRASLHAGAPMVMTVTNNAGGHAIVCDGYGYAEDGTLLFHVNYGWGGNGNKWEPLSWFSYFPGTYDSKFQFQTITFNTHPNALGCVLAGRVVRNKTGVEGVTVLLTKKGDATPQEVTTNAVGAYVITGLSETTDYTITVKEEGEVVETREISTGRFVDSPARQKAQDAWEEANGKDGHYVPIEGGNVVADFDLPVPVEKRYVTASGTGDGSSWENAAGLTKTFLETVPAGTEVYVASGDYTVTEMLTIPAGVTVKGGYNGDTRDVIGTPTTITLGGTSGYSPSHLFDVNGGVLDGFILHNSQALSNATVQGGAVKNCIFTGDVKMVAENCTLECCIVRNRSATQEGCSLIHCTFYDAVPAGEDDKGGTVAGCLATDSSDMPDAALKGTCTCGACPEVGLDGRALEKTPGALAPAVASGYQLRLR